MRPRKGSDDDEAYHHPVLAVSHGPGPLWLLKHGVEGRSSRPARNVANIFKKLYPGGVHKPKRILLVSAHWETYRLGFEISKSPAPGMLFDYEGFPPEAYKVVYPAKGDADFANEVAMLLTRSKIKATQVLRAFDHAAFVPMTLIRRQADIPVVTLSINWKLNARAHLELGRALAPLRDQDTLIICSGQATHGLRGEGNEVPPLQFAFQEWLDSVLTRREDDDQELTFAQRREKLLAWEAAPGALEAHPRADHFMPFLVAAGAGMEKKDSEATKLFGGWGVENHLSYASYAWGAPAAAPAPAAAVESAVEST
jgi:4,5-DOPA dioxygenase extradiol